MKRLRDFVAAWCDPDDPAERVSEDELEALETEIGLTFPQDYRASILAIGVPKPMMTLWEWVIDQDENDAEPGGIDRHILAEFHTPADIREARGWTEAGMPDDLVPFVSDGMGNQICFSILDLCTGGGGAVYFWDHDLLETELEAANFTEWLQPYLP